MERMKQINFKWIKDLNKTTTKLLEENVRKTSQHWI